MNDKFVLAGHDPTLAVLTGAVEELVHRFSTKVFFEVFEAHRVNLALRRFQSNNCVIQIFPKGDRESGTSGNMREASRLT